MGFGHRHHGHDHEHHGHEHPVIEGEHPTLLNARHQRVLQMAFGLTFLYMVVEIAGGLITGSLALLADGFHMFGDTMSIGIALFAAWLSHRPAPAHRTFGYQRIEILAAFFNGLILIAMSAIIILESIDRLQSPVPIQADLMMVIAVGGLIINITAAWLLHRDMHTNLNIRGAFLHVLGDLLGSVAALTAGFLIFTFGWTWADPLISGFIALLVALSAVNLLRDSINVLLEGCPRHLKIDEIRREIQAYQGIEAVHHLHIWHIDSQRIVLTAHLEVLQEAFSGKTLSDIQETLKCRFGLTHVTLQMELAHTDSP
jgi:cobalt-zinc-cadmium efflux system protein